LPKKLLKFKFSFFSKAFKNFIDACVAKKDINIYINTFIITGQMDSYMLQPKDPLINVLTSKCNFSAFGDLVYGIVIGLFATQFDLKKYILVLLFGMIGAIYFLSTEIILRSLSVWIKDTEKLATRYYHTLLMYIGKMLKHKKIY